MTDEDCSFDSLPLDSSEKDALLDGESDAVVVTDPVVDDSSVFDKETLAWNESDSVMDDDSLRDAVSEIDIELDFW